jgi:phage shock protein A
MSLLSRLSRLFQADFHAVLDRIEEPEALLRQAVREMQEELARDGRRVKVLEGERDRILTRQTRLEQSLDEIEVELDICLESAQDDLARALIKRKLHAQRLVGLLQGKRETLEKNLAGLRDRLREHTAHLDNIRQKAELLAEEDTCGSQEDHWRTPDLPIADADVEVALLREKHKRSRP